MKKSYDTLKVYCNVNGFKTESILFVNPSKSKHLNVEFFLTKDSIYSLDTVIINVKKKFYQKKDTIGYVASEYIDGTERKVKDLLKKLPEIDVNERNGTVKYKGKEIETITLDGDNLFGSNYTLATKNINVDIIKAVEAIDNYEENELLKGISSGGKVSLNLVLKENKTDFSGTGELGLGLLNDNEFARGLSASLLTINKKQKSFFTLTSNNVGVNNSPFVFENGIKTSEQRREENYLAYSVLSSLSSNSSFGTERGNINNQYFGNFNSLIPLNKNLKIKLNGYYLKDEVSGRNFSEQVLFDSESGAVTSIFDNTTFTNKPKYYRGDIDIKYRLNKRSMLSFISKIQNENSDDYRKTNSNNDNFIINLNSRNNFFKNLLEYTYKLNDSTVFQSRIHYSKNKLPQSMNLNMQSPVNQSERINQFSEFSKDYLSFDSRLIGKIGKWKYGTQLEFYINNNDYNSSLLNTVDLSNNSVNDLDRANVSFSNQSYCVVEYNQWRFSIKNRFEFLEQRLTGFSNQQNFIINPSLAVVYTLGEKRTLSLNTSYSKSPLDIQNSFINQVLIDNRTLILNSPTLDLQENFSLGLYYANNNIFKQLVVSSGIQYSEVVGDYFQDLSFDSENIFIRNFYLSEKSKNLSTNFSLRKYLNAISSNIKVRLSGNYNQYFNLVNSSNLRSNELFSFNTSIEFNTSFDFPLNFGNEFSYNYTESKFDNNINVFRTINNNSKLIFKSKNRMIYSLNSAFFNPNIDSSLNTAHFLDFKFRYNPKGKNWNFSFHANNLLNNSTYERFEISDFSSSKFQNQLLGRIFMVSLEYSF
ncbi:TonB-dependent receptor [Winogradskyella sp. PC D3.3]